MDRIYSLYKKISPKHAYIDALLITSNINRYYLSGVKSSSGALLAFRNNKVFLLVDFRYYEAAKSAAFEGITVVKSDDYYKRLKELLRMNRAVNVAVEPESVTVSELRRLQEKLGPFTAIDTGHALSKAIKELRSVKTPDEIEKIRSAQKIAESAFKHILSLLKPGMTEREAAFEIDSFMLKNGAEALSFETIVLSGANTSLPHGFPTDKKIEKGDFVLMDFGAVYQGYHSDMTRTVCVGLPGDEMKKIYNIALEAQERCIKLAAPGVAGKSLDACARDYISEHGYGENFGHGLGHSVGMEIHEFPSANSKNPEKLKKNNIITIEPGIYLEKKFGVRIEDMVVITSDGCENLTSAPKELIQI